MEVAAIAPEEQAFLETLKADPGDDVTRLVYADWLEERGDPRGTFLRAEQQLAALNEDEPRFAEFELELGEQSRTLDEDWLYAAGKRWDVWLFRYQPTLKLCLIKAAIQLTNCRLLEAKNLIEVAPGRVARACSLVHAGLARDHLQACRLSDSEVPPPHVAASIRPCPDPKASHSLPTLVSFELWLLGRSPEKENELVEALRQLFSWEESRVRGSFASLPWHLGSFPTEADARGAAELLPEPDQVEVRRRSPPAVPAMRETFGPGGYDVWLAAYTPEAKPETWSEQRVGIIKAWRQVIGMSLAEAKKRAEEPLPQPIVRGVDRAAVDRLRTRFTGLGTLQIRTQPAL